MTLDPDGNSKTAGTTMNNQSGASTSVWMATSEVAPQAQLSRDETADVCVIGAGIAGMTTAYLLAREGKTVAVLDDGPVGGGETGRTTAHLSNALDDRYSEIERLHGSEGLRLTAESHTAAISHIEAIVNSEKIDCDFERLDGYLFVPPGDPLDVLDQELAAAHRAGLPEVILLERAPLDFNTGPSLKFPRQGQFHPLKYLAGLSRAIRRNGGQIFTFTHAEKIEGGSPARVTTKNGPVVSARDIVVATNTPVNNLVAVHTKQAAYRTYVIGITVPAGSVTKALYWDTGKPYHYLRIHPISADERRERSEEILIVGGEDHKTGQADDTDDRYERLEQWTRERFPSAGDLQYRWSGQVMETIDGLAYIGQNALDEPNVYIATGDSGMGMTHCTIAGILVTDLIAGRENRWAELYDPSRKTVAAAPRYLRENLNVMAQYADQFTGGEVDSADEVATGSGSVIRRGLSKIAVYRDQQGVLHEHSAVCPHLGCVVGWNAAEKTWDCPCHGSRFDPYGSVVNGPAISGLTQVEPTQPDDRSARKAASRSLKSN